MREGVGDEGEERVPEAGLGPARELSQGFLSFFWAFCIYLVGNNRQVLVMVPLS